MTDVRTPRHDNDQPVATFDAGDLDLASGLMFALDVCLSEVSPGEVLEVVAANPSVTLELPAWARRTGNEVVTTETDGPTTRIRIRRGRKAALMFKDLPPDWGARVPLRRDELDTRDWLVGRAGEIPVRADPATGFSPRGALVEEASPHFPFTENERNRVWAENVAALQEQATAQQWDASRDISWQSLPDLPKHVEWAVCQIMTNLAENEYSALYVPAKFIPRIHPHFTEVILFLSTQVADEARHIEAFTKRALANGGGLQYSTSATQQSLKSLLEQEDFSQASFLLSVLGEGTFLEYLAYVERYAPDPVTADIVRRARNDESRHVAFGVEHAKHYLASDPDRARELRDAVASRAEYLAAASAGSNPYVEDALVVLAAGGLSPGSLPDGVRAMQGLKQDMHEHRVRRLRAIGFSQAQAEDISEMHTPNFM